MMFRAVLRVVLPLAVATPLCFPCAGQTTGGSSVAEAPTIGSSTSLNSNSNDLVSLYGSPVVEIIARVNDQVITNSDLARAKSQLAQDARRNNLTIEQIDKGQKNLLRDLIDQQLLLSKGKQLGITGDTQLIQKLDQIRKENHLDSLEDLQKAVEQQGITYEDFKANIRNSIISQQVVQNEVGAKLQLSQADLKKYYQDHLDQFTHQESIHLSEILIPTSEDATDDQLAVADAKAKEVEAKLKSGASFADMAKEYSSGPTAQQGGELGDFHRGALAKVLEDQTFDLPVGGYTAPIRTRQGYVILQVTKHIPGGVEPLQKVERQVEQAVYMEKIGPAVRQYLTRLRNEAYIDIRPGYTDSGASPEEFKGIEFAAYEPPQTKKKKNKVKSRYDNQARFSRAAVHKTKTSAEAARSDSSGHVKLARKFKPEKFRYGRAPSAPVSAAQVATTETASGPESPAASGNTTNAATEASTNGTYVQPLGPDLEHPTLITQPKRVKRRFSDEARIRKEAKAREKRVKGHQAKQSKPDNARPTPLTPAEAANARVQNAALGLNGSTATKKKKAKRKKPAIRNGKKIRLSDEKKIEEQSKEKGASAAPGSQTSSSSAGQPQ